MYLVMRFFDFNFYFVKIFAQNDSTMEEILNKCAEGTNWKALAFQQLYKRGLGDIPKSLGGKGGFQGGKERTKRFLFSPLVE